MPTEAEEWRPVTTHPGRYEVSNLGRVRTVERRAQVGPILRTFPVRILRTVCGGRARNYLRVHLYEPERFAFVHCLVAEAFIGARPAGLLVLHRDDDGRNNRADNLRYGDRMENETDRHVHAWNRENPDAEEAPF